MKRTTIRLEKVARELKKEYIQSKNPAFREEYERQLLRHTELGLLEYV